MCFVLVLEVYIWNLTSNKNYLFTISKNYQHTFYKFLYHIQQMACTRFSRSKSEAPDVPRFCWRNECLFIREKHQKENSNRSPKILKWTFVIRCKMYLKWYFKLNNEFWNWFISNLFKQSNEPTSNICLHIFWIPHMMKPYNSAVLDFCLCHRPPTSEWRKIKSNTAAYSKLTWPNDLAS